MTQQNIFLSQMSQGLIGSEILKIAGEIRAKIARGEPVYNLTVGDFRPDLFPIPRPLLEGIIEALRAAPASAELDQPSSFVGQVA